MTDSLPTVPPGTPRVADDLDLLWQLHQEELAVARAEGRGEGVAYLLLGEIVLGLVLLWFRSGGL